MSRVMVFTMHEAQRAQAEAALQNHSTTDGFVVGDADQQTIDALRAAGMIVNELEDAPPPGPGLQALGAGGGGPQLPGYYTAWVQQPVLPAYHQQLDAAGIRMQEARGDRFVFHVKDAAQLAALKAFPWIKNLKEYDLEDTLKGIGGRTTVTARWDLVLHDGASVKDLRHYLDHAPGVKVVKVTDHKIQIQAAEQDAIACGERVEVAAVLPWKAPTLRTDRARELTRAHLAVNAPNGGLTGKGVVVGVCDSGLDETHAAFQNKERIVIAKGRDKDASDPHGHGTHVAGTICGAPPPKELAGIAPAAKLVFQSVMDADGNLSGIGDDMMAVLKEAYGHGARIHNNSWGADVEGATTTTTMEIDRFVWENPDMLVVIAAGNAGSVRDPVAGMRRSAPGDIEWFSVGAPGTSKNALVVGASRSDRTKGGWSTLTHADVWPDRFGPPATMAADTISGDPESLAAFSSRGLSDDQRIKPDVVAPGTDIAAPRAVTSPSYHFAGMVPNTDRRYGFMSGTSMATPVASGLAALLVEYLVRERGIAKPSAALLKAILINGARPLGGSGTQTNPHVVPNPHQGFGRLDLAASIPIDPADPFVLALVDSWSQNKPPFLKNDPARRRRFELTTTKAGPLSLTLAYTDYWTRSAQNNLDLLLETPQAGAPMVANESLKQLLPMKFPDPTNNIEVIKIANAPAGTYIASVFATNINFDPQHYALAVTGALASPAMKEL